ncbi:MAG: AAA family ATPase [Gammaproteobacteria bacterium]
MYETFFGFREKPFSLLPDPSYLFLSKQHGIALELLNYSVMNQAGFVVITGGIGTGKTILIRHLLNHIDKDITVGLITNTHRGFGELLPWVLHAFSLDHSQASKVDLYQTFVDFIVAEYALHRRTVLIIDEAQNMTPETLEELRMLSNVNSEKDQVLQVILCGQPGLRDMLCKPDLAQFAQRITSDYDLTALGSEDTQRYIRHRIEVAGGPTNIFEDQAYRSVYEHTGVVPRLINLICDTSLVYGYAEQLKTISAALIEEVVKDKRRGGLYPRPKPVSSTDSEHSFS